MAEAAQHQALSDTKPFEGSGKDVYKAFTPIQSVNPTSEEQGFKTTGKRTVGKLIDKPNLDLTHTPNTAPSSRYGIDKIEPGKGMFIPVEQNSTTDKLMMVLYREVADARMSYAEVERDREGNEIWDCVIVKTRKTNDDGTYQLGADGKPLEGANQTIQPRLVYGTHYAVKAVVKGDDIGEGQKAEHDGAMVIRRI
jgi:hypothetical protein